MNSFFIEQKIHPVLRDCKMKVRYIGEKYFHINADAVERIKQLKNTKKGEVCFIVGNGPSVRIQDLNAIHSHHVDSFGANAISDLFEKTSWRPDYYSVMDPTFLFKGKSGLTPQIQHNYITEQGIQLAFYTDVLQGFIDGNPDNAVFLNTQYCPIFSERFKDFSTEIEYRINDLGGVTHYNIEIAIYMGYQKIILYGVDNSYTKYLDTDGRFKINNKIESHAEGIAKTDLDEHIEAAPETPAEAFAIGGFADKRKSDDGYSKCLAYAKEHDIAILNATRGGALDIFERIDFDYIFKDRGICLKGNFYHSQSV